MGDDRTVSAAVVADTMLIMQEFIYQSQSTTDDVMYSGKQSDLCKARLRSLLRDGAIWLPEVAAGLPGLPDRPCPARPCPARPHLGPRDHPHSARPRPAARPGPARRAPGGAPGLPVPGLPGPSVFLSSRGSGHFGARGFGCDPG